MSHAIRVYEKEQLVIAKRYDNRECWVPGKDSLVTVKRNTKGNLLDPSIYNLTFGEAVKRGYLSDDRGTMSFSIQNDVGVYLHWVVGLETFGFLIDNDIDQVLAEYWEKARNSEPPEFED